MLEGKNEQRVLSILNGSTVILAAAKIIVSPINSGNSSRAPGNWNQRHGACRPRQVGKAGTDTE